MHDEIDGFGNLSFRVNEGRLGMVAHDEIGEAMQAFSANCMDCSQRPGEWRC